jgi:hypothetical protein
MRKAIKDAAIIRGDPQCVNAIAKDHLIGLLGEMRAKKDGWLGRHNLYVPNKTKSTESVFWANIGSMNPAAESKASGTRTTNIDRKCPKDVTAAL